MFIHTVHLKHKPITNHKSKTRSRRRRRWPCIYICRNYLHQSRVDVGGVIHSHSGESTKQNPHPLINQSEKKKKKKKEMRSVPRRVHPNEQLLKLIVSFQIRRPICHSATTAAAAARRRRRSREKWVLVIYRPLLEDKRSGGCPAPVCLSFCLSDQVV